MGSVHAKPSSSTGVMKKQHGIRSSSNSLMLPLLIKGIMLALAASALPFLVIYPPPSLKLLLFDVIPTLWRCSCDLFTPKNLFVLLNLIILSILAMAHLHSSQAASASSSALHLRPLHPARRDWAQATSDPGAVNRSISEEFKLDSQKSADLQLVDEVDSTNEQISDIQQATKHGADEGDHQDNQASTSVMVIQEAIIETHLQQAVDDHGKHLAERRKTEAEIKKAKTGPSEPPESRKAEKAKTDQSDPVESKKVEKAKTGQSEPVATRKAEKCEKAKTGQQSAAAESKKAEKATSTCTSLIGGNPLPPDKFYSIESLLSEEGSIFTRVEGRPLPSARFSSKKAPKLSGLDRPLSPLKMSRPILKRGDTLDATWKAICESKRHSSPLNRHYSSKHTRKGEPYEDIIEGVANKPMSSYPSPLSPLKQRSKIPMSSLHDKEVVAKAHPLKRREPSMPQEELNAKVESFISRFNEQIRIQREKSLLDYMEMVGRGSS